MTKQTRSNAPLALSVASMTEPGNIPATVSNIMEFDGASIGFTHHPTWEALPVALRGVINPDSSHIVFAGTHPRVEACIRALLFLGKQSPVEARRFSDFPEARLKPVNDIEWAPGVTIKVKGVCWFVRDGRPVIPLLQPRKKPLSEGSMGLYSALGQQAFCKGDWQGAVVDLVDLSGDDKTVVAQSIKASELPKLDERMIAQYITTYVAAKQRADALRAAKPKKPPKPKSRGLFDPPSDPNDR